MDGMDLMWIPVHRSWRLNQRHYGALQGLYKQATVEKYGYEQVQKWRRSYDIRPPALDKADHRHPGFDPRYSLLKDEELPSTECLKDTLDGLSVSCEEVWFNIRPSNTEPLVRSD